MRILTAMMKHETNTFSPVPTNLARFEAWGLHRGDEVVAAYTGTNMPIAAYIDLAREQGAEIVSPVAAEAMPGGLVEKETCETLCDWILHPLDEGGIDAVFLDLHGAMTAGHEPDGEGALLKRMRAIAPGIPICVTFDMHTNLTADIVDNCDVLIGYKSYPHTDMYDVGHQIGRVMWDKLLGKTNPVMAWSQVPVLAQTLRMGTADEPMKSLQDLTRSQEAAGILAATVFGGFPMADVEHAGVSVVAIADGDTTAAQDCCNRLYNACWASHEELIYRHRPLGEAIETARRKNKAPVILLDHADNVGSGGTADVMTIIAEVLKAGLDDVAVAAVYDPQAAAAMHAAGTGAEITLELGGKTDMPQLGLTGKPLTLAGTVLNLANGRWVVKGPMYTGVTVDTGPTAVLAVGGMKIVVTSIHHEPWDAGILSENGIDPMTCKYILLKSRIHYRAGFQPIQPDLTAHFTLDGEGVTTSDNSAITYTKLRRPIYPLDPASAIHP